LKIQSQNTTPTYENNVISNTIHLNNYYIFCDQNASFFFPFGFFLVLNYFSMSFSLRHYSFLFLFLFLVLDYFLLLFITISLFLLIFYLFIVIIFFIEHAYFMPDFWVLHKPFKTNQPTFYASNVGITKSFLQN
jgi:hypothetical protein